MALLRAAIGAWTVVVLCRAERVDVKWLVAGLAYDSDQSPGLGLLPPVACGAADGRRGGTSRGPQRRGRLRLARSDAYCAGAQHRALVAAGVLHPDVVASRPGCSRSSRPSCAWPSSRAVTFVTVSLITTRLRFYSSMMGPTFREVRHAGNAAKVLKVSGGAAAALVGGEHAVDALQCRGPLNAALSKPRRFTSPSKTVVIAAAFRSSCCMAFRRRPRVRRRRPATCRGRPPGARALPSRLRTDDVS